MLVRYRDVDLPTFENTRQLLRTHEQFRAASLFDKDLPFLRHARIHAPGVPNITELMDRTGEELNRVVDFCGAVVVPHTFGLYKTRLPKGVHEKRLLPIGYVLAAEVAPIKGQSLTLEQSVQVGSGLSQYYRGQSDGKLSDITPQQFKYGSIPPPNVGETERQSELWLHDIEPRLLRVHRQKFK